MLIEIIKKKEESESAIPLNIVYESIPLRGVPDIFFLFLDQIYITNESNNSIFPVSTFLVDSIYSLLLLKLLLCHG